MNSSDFDQRFDAGESVVEQKRVNVDCPLWMIVYLDRVVNRLGVTGAADACMIPELLPHRAPNIVLIRLSSMAGTPSRQGLRRWGNSLGIRLPASIARGNQLQVDQAVELSVVEGGVTIRPVQHCLSLAERLEAYEPTAGEPTEAMAFHPLGTEVIE